MNIKQKLTGAFAVIACLPIVVVASIVILNLRNEATNTFTDSSNREIRQVENAMQLFFEGISQNVDNLASDPLLLNAGNNVKSYISADAPSVPASDTDRQLTDLFTRLIKSHPAYAYVQFGLSNGGYAIGPGEPQLKNYDPRTRP